MSRLGAAFCAVYALITAPCLMLAFSGGDAKGRFVFLQLPLAPHMALVHELGLDPLMKDLNWAGAYALLGIPTFMLLYGLGWLIGRLWKARP